MHIAPAIPVGVGVRLGMDRIESYAFPRWLRKEKRAR